MNDVYISHSTAVAARELAGEMIIMSAVDSTLFSLNETASLIWQAADGITPLSEIVELRICNEFDVVPEEGYRDAVALVEELAGHGNLQLSAQPITESTPEVAKIA